MPLKKARRNGGTQCSSQASELSQVQSQTTSTPMKMKAQVAGKARPGKKKTSTTK